MSAQSLPCPAPSARDLEAPKAPPKGLIRLIEGLRLMHEEETRPHWKRILLLTLRDAEEDLAQYGGQS